MNTENKAAQQLQHKRNLVAMNNIGDDSKLTKQECLDMMGAAISVQDWNALREIVKSDYEYADVPQDLQKLLHQIDGEGMIVKVLRKNEERELNEIPADMVVDLDDVKLLSAGMANNDQFLDDSEG